MINIQRSTRKETRCTVGLVASYRVDGRQRTAVWLGSSEPTSSELAQNVGHFVCAAIHLRSVQPVREFNCKTFILVLDMRTNISLHQMLISWIAHELQLWPHCMTDRVIVRNVDIGEKSRRLLASAWQVGTTAGHTGRFDSLNHKHLN